MNILNLCLVALFAVSLGVCAKGGGGGGHASAHVSAHASVSEGHMSGAHISESVPIAHMTPTARSALIPNSRTFYVIHNNSQTQASEATDPLLVTVCDGKEFSDALKWQGLCKEDSEINSGYCALLSYFRYCKQADIADVGGLQPAGKDYHNVFLYVDRSPEPK
jgi:hypothetical protein